VPPPAAPTIKVAANVKIPEHELVTAGNALRSHKPLKSKSQIIADKECPECKGQVQIAEGCMLCLSCGFSACAV
jgi:hypothetical protein